MLHQSSKHFVWSNLAGTAPINEDHNVDVHLAAFHLGNVGLPDTQRLRQLYLGKTCRPTHRSQLGLQGLIARMVD